MSVVGLSLKRMQKNLKPKIGFILLLPKMYFFLLIVPMILMHKILYVLYAMIDLVEKMLNWHKKYVKMQKVVIVLQIGFIYFIKKA